MSYTDQVNPRIVLVVLLQGNTRRVKGPMAAEVAGRIYRSLREHNYFATNRQESFTTAALGGSRP